MERKGSTTTPILLAFLRCGGGLLLPNPLALAFVDIGIFRKSRFCPFSMSCPNNYIPPRRNSHFATCTASPEPQRATFATYPPPMEHARRSYFATIHRPRERRTGDGLTPSKPMPKKHFVKIHLPPKPPPRCELCPFCGMIPREQRTKGTRQTYVCVMTMRTMSGKGIKADERRHNARHPLHRHCKNVWGKYRSSTAHAGAFPVAVCDVRTYLQPMRERREPRLF